MDRPATLVSESNAMRQVLVFDPSAMRQEASILGAWVAHGQVSGEISSVGRGAVVWPGLSGAVRPTGRRGGVA